MNAPNQNVQQSLVTRIIVVQNKMGIHARPAAMIVRLANRFENTHLSIEKGSMIINGKSIMSVMMLAASERTQLKMTAIGPQANELLDDMEALFASKFKEN